MKTEKKNQHYVPKFYLKQFSFQNNLKQIGLFNSRNSLFIEKAPLKTQGSKNFYYGDDGTIENKLSEIEGILAFTIKEICETGLIPTKDTEKYFSLLAFISITHLRNPISIEGKIQAFEAARNKLIELHPKTDIDKLMPAVTHDQALELSFGMVNHIMQMIRDLEIKILINKTNLSFITSDNPIVKYNQFLESRNWHGSKTGFGVVGLQIFVPLNQNVMLVLFDNSIYKIGNKKQKTIEISKPSEVYQLNLLQILNCTDTIYFNHSFNEFEARSLFEKSKKFIKANISKASIATLVEPNEKETSKDNLLIMHNSDCEINLSISSFKIHSKGKSHKLHPSMAQLRPHCQKIRDFNHK